MEFATRSDRPVLGIVMRATIVAVLASALLATGLPAGLGEAHAARLSRTQQMKLDRYRRHIAKASGVDVARQARYERHLARARRRMSRPLPRGWRTARVSWYGPGFYGRGMAGGGKLAIASMIVAHRTLPFGTKVQFYYNGKTITVPVKDRGPYVSGREFDLGPGTARYLGMMSVGTVQYRILGS